MTNKHRKVWKVVSRKPFSGKQMPLDGAHDNSRFACDFREAIPGCFSFISISMNSAIHLKQ
jgi:hypothetical protein